MTAASGKALLNQLEQSNQRSPRDGNGRADHEEEQRNAKSQSDRHDICSRIWGWAYDRHARPKKPRSPAASLVFVETP